MVDWFGLSEESIRVMTYIVLNLVYSRISRRFKDVYTRRLAERA